MSVQILTGDCRTMLATLPAGSAQTCVTSPPYLGLRDYGHEQQIGFTDSPEDYIADMVAVFREVRRVLADDGTLWLNLGDSFVQTSRGMRTLLGMPWRVALALMQDGWCLRSDIIWHKPNAQPESVKDRPSKAHEYVFLLAKSDRYYYDAEALREENQTDRAPSRTFNGRGVSRPYKVEVEGAAPTLVGRDEHEHTGRNARSVWSISTQPFPGAHFATMPLSLAERCIVGGSRPGDTVLDPFGGAGTTGLVADRLGRNAVLVEVNPANVELARTRIRSDAPLFAEVAV